MYSGSLRFLVCAGVGLASLWGTLGHSPGLVLCIGTGGHWALEFACGPKQDACTLPESSVAPGGAALVVGPVATCCMDCSDIPLAPHGDALQTASLTKKPSSGDCANATASLPSSTPETGTVRGLPHKAPLAGELLPSFVRCTVLLT